MPVIESSASVKSLEGLRVVDQEYLGLIDRGKVIIIVRLGSGERIYKIRHAHTNKEHDAWICGLGNDAWGEK